MDPITGTAAGITLIQAASNLLARPSKETANGVFGHGDVKKARNFLKSANSAGSSITSISKQTTILSRVYIDESVIGEIVLPNIMRSTHEWYCAQIVSALHLKNMVTDKKTVEDILSVVQTGSNAHSNSLSSRVLSRMVGQESFGISEEDVALEAMYSTPGSHRKNDSEDKGPRFPRDSETADRVSLMKAITSDTDLTKATAEHRRVVENKDTIDAVKSVKVGDNRIGPMGELYEIKLANPTTGASTVVPIFIQMQPSVIPFQYAPRFIDLNVTPTVWKRWLQKSAGEIRFWKDFVFGLDLARRQMSIQKDPEAAHAFSGFLKSVNEKDFYALSDITNKSADNQSHNLSNSVVIFSQDAVTAAKVESGIDLHSAADRQSYFKNTYSMIVIIIDPLHQRVTVYFNGIDGELNLSYSDLKPKDSKFDPNDFMQAMSAFSTNQIGRLR